MVKPKHKVPRRRKSDSALFKKIKFRENILMKIYAEQTINTYTQSHSDANSSIAQQLLNLQLIVLLHYLLKS